MLDTRGPATRRPRFRRHRFGKPAFVFTERDRAILKLVAEHRLISSEEIRALIEGSDQQILRRLQVLFHGGYLDRPRQQLVAGNAKFVYALGARGAAELARIGADVKRDARWSERNRTLRFPYIQHQLMVSRFRTALTLACRPAGHVVERWIEGAALHDEIIVEHDDWRERVPVCPDACFNLRIAGEPEGQNRVHVVLEADRSTMTVKRFTAKLIGYWHWWRSGQQERLGMKNFLVVTVTRSPERLANLLQAARAVDQPKGRGLRMFLFGWQNEYAVDNPAPVLGAMWRSAADEVGRRLTD